MPELTSFECISCHKTFPISSRNFRCSCGELLEVKHDWNLFSPIKELLGFQNVPSGVWRYKPLIYPGLPKEAIIMRGEGRTGLYEAPKKVLSFAECSNLTFKHEGENPTGSFKDRGMTVGISEANRLKVRSVLCASTGNTSASLAAYASFAGINAKVIIPKEKVAFGKLAQALAYGAEVYQVEGTFDESMKVVLRLIEQEGYYLLNSINPWRIEGQKTIIFELLENLEWKVPDWIVVPAGNLGNTSAFGKALKEALKLEMINTLPRIVAVQATGAQPFVNYWKTGDFIPDPKPNTLATAINIGDPISYSKAIIALRATDGLATSVSDRAIMDAKAIIDSSGVGCEPASATTLAGIKKLINEGTILPSEKIVAILTGHMLKDPQIVLNYHQDRIKNVRAEFANRIMEIQDLEKRSTD